MKHILLALTLFVAFSCGSDDDETPRYNEVKVVLNNESETNFICGLKYDTYGDETLSVSYTEETVDIDGTVIDAKLVTSAKPEGYIVVHYDQFKGNSPHRRIKDVTFVNATTKFQSTLAIVVCTYLPAGLNAVNVATTTQLTNIASSADYGTAAQLSGSMHFYEHYLEAGKIKQGVSDLKRLQCVSSACQYDHPSFALAADSNQTRLVSTIILNENSDAERDLSKYNLIWTTSVNIEEI